MNTTRVAKLLRDLADELEQDDTTTLRADDWIDQYHSPLGKRKHLDLVRLGVLHGKKPDRVHVYVRRSEVDAYLDEHPAKRPVAPAPDGAMGEPTAEQLASRVRSRLGLVRMKTT